MILRPVAPPVEYGITKRLARAGNAAIAFLRSLGTSAHVWLPGANGTTVASLPSNNYLLSNGSTGYSTVDGVVGLDLDGMGSLGAEKVINGSFDSDTAWTKGIGVTISGGKINYTGFTTSSTPTTPITIVAGSTYRLVTTGRTYVSGSLAIEFGGASIVLTANLDQFVKATTTASLVLNSAAFEGSFSSISIQEYTGTHLTQATTANKPLVRRGMYNLLTQNTDLTNAAWSASSATRSALNIATASAGYQYVWQISAAASAAANPYTAAFIVSRLVGTGTISISADSGTTYTVITVTSTPTLFVVAAGTGATARGAALLINDSGDSVQIDGVGLFQGTWTAAQILAEGGIPTTTATAASNPSAGKYWWSFDGSNDSLLSGNLGITNACTIVVAGRVNSVGATQVLFDEGVNGVQFYISTTGAVVLAKPGAGNILASSAGVIAAGVPFVLTARSSGGTLVFRNLGVQFATTATAITFSATSGAKIGAEFTTGGVLNGALGWVVPLPVALSDADCLTVERLVSSQFPNGPVF